VLPPGKFKDTIPEPLSRNFTTFSHSVATVTIIANAGHQKQFRSLLHSVMMVRWLTVGWCLTARSAQKGHIVPREN